MHRTSIGTWAYNIGPYAERTIPFDVVGPKLKELGFGGLELGGFNGYPNPGDLPQREQREALKEKVEGWGLGISGFAADLWSQHLIDTGGQLELIERLSGRINHIHLIDSDNSCHKDAAVNDETSAHVPFGDGVVDFDAILPRLAEEKLPHDWWTIDLCFWADAWEVTGRCKRSLDELNRRYG